MNARKSRRILLAAMLALGVLTLIANVGCIPTSYEQAYENLQVIRDLGLIEMFS